MIIRTKKVVGRGIKYRGNYGYITRQGSGMFDFFKPIIGIAKSLLENKEVISNVATTASNVYNIGKNTKDIVNLIRKPRQIEISKIDDIEDIISRINKIRTGSGFAYA